MKRRLATALWNQMVREKFISFGLMSAGYTVTLLPDIREDIVPPDHANAAGILREMADALDGSAA